ncbi:AraC family transcriptional regulator [Draconibacterium sp. IB214405]|uniref:helix-turn-helix domain-containing protein n=1 Tax=Draconibacterium sp. IB214405 TaxID=3097352 RepID=UPI002A1830FE|nr:AraC family transcriptional regulator [Draconibacterium sp. IB214405]MDX8338787.1 AraC family transcriptional regulator [Draconibacterium sp. IB214405]
MLDLHSYIRNNSHYKKLIIDDLLFVEYKCVYEETRAGIWSDTNYFVFVTSGKKMWKSIYNEYVVETGDSLFVKKGANLVHQYFEEDYCALMIFIPDDFIKKFMARFAEVVRKTSEDISELDSVIRIQLDEYLEAYINSLAYFLEAEFVPDRNLLVHKLEELLLNIFTRPLHKNVAKYLHSLSKDQTTQLRQVMEDNFAFNLKLEEFSKLCNMSLSSFKRMFNSVYNISPGKWLTQKRLDLAAHLLLTTDKTVGQIAFESGFEEPSSFIRVFKQKLNCTPLQYRSVKA